VVVKGLENSGVIAALGNALAQSFPQESLTAITTIAVGNALGSNLINNWSMMMVSVSSLGVVNPLPTPGFIYAAILGADLGPNLTIVGSLSSMLWLVILRQRGLDIRPRQYFRVGLILTPLLLAFSIGSLYLMTQLA
jgi:arsenical pump membrane protein